MEEYFKSSIDNVESKISVWNNKNLFQRLIAKKKWSQDDFCNEIEKIFHLGILDQVKSEEDFNIYLKYFFDYYKALTDELFFSITEKLLISDYLNPKIEGLLKDFVNSKKTSINYNRQAMDLINSIR